MHKSHYKWIMHLQCRQRRSRPRKQPLHPINICPPCRSVSRARWERKNRADNLCVPALISSKTTAGPNVDSGNFGYYLLGWVMPLHFTLIIHWECICAKCQTTLLRKSRHYFTALNAILNVISLDKQIWSPQRWKHLLQVRYVTAHHWLKHTSPRKSSTQLLQHFIYIFDCIQHLLKANRPVYFATPLYGSDSKPGMSLLQPAGQPISILVDAANGRKQMLLERSRKSRKM